jgi:hypothetical protein
MTTEATVSVPEYLNWTTRVTGKGPNQRNTGWVLTLQTFLPGSTFETKIYPRDPAILIYPDVDGAQAAVKHSRVEPDGTTTAWESNVVEIGDVVAVQLHRDTFKENKLDGTPNDRNWAAAYFWELLSIVPSDGQVDAGAPTPPRPPANNPETQGRWAKSDDPVHDKPVPFEVRGDIKGHCEKIIGMLAVAKLLPGLEAEDGGIDWGVYRQYRDEYFHNVSNVPVEPLPSEEAEEVDEED